MPADYTKRAGLQNSVIPLDIFGRQHHHPANPITTGTDITANNNRRCVLPIVLVFSMESYCSTFLDIEKQCQSVDTSGIAGFSYSVPYTIKEELEKRMTTMYDITKQKEIFRSKRETNAIYEATCDGEPCYCLEHLPSGRMALFDRDRRVCNLLRRDIDKRGAASSRVFGKSYYFCLDDGIMLAQYLLGRYNHQTYKTIQKKNRMRVGRIYCDNIIEDLRSNKIYDTSKPVELTASRRVWSDGRYIYIHQFRNGVVDTIDYDPLLLAFFQTPSLCSFGVESHGHTIIVSPYIQNRSCRTRLYSIAYIYAYKFCDYTNLEDLLKHMNDERARLTENGAPDGYSIDHLNGDTHNNCLWNLSRMTQKENRLKGKITSTFQLPYELYSSVDHATGQYLLEIVCENIVRFYRCENATELNDFLRVLMGMSTLTKNTKMYSLSEHDGTERYAQVPTPRDLKFANKNVPIKRDFRTDNYHAEMLLQMNREQPELFTPWNVIGNGIPLKALIDNGIQVDVEPVTMGK